ncbi:hypothetical protein N0V90_011347 [Kalmusia sp. IMI 367209]|nr:hypothetical protein N0V90_011347 [Kalmusia sp. IMI 367209]
MKDVLRAANHGAGLSLWTYRGAKGADLYVKCLQLILRHQLAFLIHKKGLTTELETVVQDLWTLRISQLGNKIRSESQELGSSQVFSTQESDTEAEDDPLFLPSRKKKLQENPTLIDCLALCYLGTMTLRLPVTPGDIYTWTTEEDMPYSNAMRLLSPAMKNRLQATHQGALSPNSLLNLRRFYTSLANIEVGFEMKFSILWPPLNVPVLLFRYLKDLALPLELYDAAMKLGEYLGYDFALHITAKQKLNIADLPEAQLMSCLVICVKLIFPFDDTIRHPKSVSEPAATAVNWAEWSKLMQEAKAEARGGRLQYTTQELTKLEEKDVFDMSNHQLDQYLDFYLTNFLDDTYLQPNGAVDDFHAALYDMFPVTAGGAYQRQQPPTDSQSAMKFQLVRDVHRTTREVRAIADADDSRVNRPGVEYVEYKTEKAMPEHARRFYEEAARVAGLSLHMLVRSVRYLERKIARQKGRRSAPQSEMPAEVQHEEERQF